MDTIPSPPQLPSVDLADALRPSRAHDAAATCVRIARGVRLHPTPGQSVWQQQREVGLARCMAAAHSVSGMVALTHEAAALVHGLWLRHGETDIRVAVASNPKHTRRAMQPVVFSGGRPPQASTQGRAVSIRRRRSRLRADEVTVVNGLRVTTLMRTAVDCAFDLPARDSITIVDSAMRALCQPDRFDPEPGEKRWQRIRCQLLAAVESEGRRRGAVRARAVAAMASPYAESPGESLVRRLVIALGLPPPELQFPVEIEQGLSQRFLDLGWPGFRVAIEFDGRSKYSSREDAWNEKTRQDAITALGWSFIRVTYSDLDDEGLLALRIMEQLPPAATANARRVKGLWE